MSRRALDGMLAGAVGTCAINLVTYLDMTVRGRAPSEVPAKSAERLADSVGLPLDRPLSGNGADANPADLAAHRRSGLGALLGYVDGIGVGILHGLLADRAPRPLAAVGTGIAAMAGSDLSSTALGATHPSKWSASAWLADVVPHLAYGFATAYAYSLLANRPRS